MSGKADILVIGAGIVGLATAYQLLRQNPGLKITVLEKEEGPALHQSSHNSGVVHSGVYYKPGSLKAENCLQGRKELLEFCDTHQISYQPITKLIMATEMSEIPRLEEIALRGKHHQIPGLELIGPEKIQEIEPAAKGVKAIFIPQCHIIDFSKVAHRLSQLLIGLGSQMFFRHRVCELRKENDEIIAVTEKGFFKTKYLINCGGLFSDRIARMTTPLSHQIVPFRGEYYRLRKEKADLVRGLIYPVPDPRFPFLGVHLSRMIDGSVEAGPNAVLALAREGYTRTTVNMRDCAGVFSYAGFWKMAFRYWQAGAYELYRSMSKRLFLRDVQKLMPDLKEGDLESGRSGVRAQMVMQDGKLNDDFALIEEDRMIHVLNAPSPAATACFAIGRHIAKKVEKQGAALVR